MNNEIFSELKILSDKAIKYDNMKGRYEEIAKKINEGISILKEAMEMMDPVITISNKHIGPKMGWTAKVVEEMYKRMEMGLEVSMPVLEKEYPDIPKTTLMYISSVKLRHLHNVSQRKEGSRSFLYINKNVK